MQYLTQLHDLHEDWLEGIPNSTFIDARQYGDFVANDVLKIIETRLLLTTIHCDAGPARTGHSPAAYNADAAANTPQ